MPAEAARSCTCLALSGLVKAPSGTTNPSSFNSAWARRASATWVFARSLSAVLALSFFGARDREAGSDSRSEEHTSELQSLAYLVCRLLLEKKKKKKTRRPQAY